MPLGYSNPSFIDGHPLSPNIWRCSLAGRKRLFHKQKNTGSNPVTATMSDECEGLARNFPKVVEKVRLLYWTLICPRSLKDRRRSSKPKRCGFESYRGY